MRRYWWLVGLGIAGLIVLLLAPLASPDPDGLERVAEDHGFLAQAQDALYSILPDYSVPGLDDPAITTIVAGLVGVVIVFGLMWGLGMLLSRRRRSIDRETP
jgi:hypothetical protein